MEHARRVDNGIYSRKALAAAREAYSEYCVVRATPEGSGLVTIAVTVKPQYEADGRQICLEFWNYFLDTACSQRLAAD